MDDFTHVFGWAALLVLMVLTAKTFWLLFSGFVVIAIVTLTENGPERNREPPVREPIGESYAYRAEQRRIAAEANRVESERFWAEIAAARKRG